MTDIRELGLANWYSNTTIPTPGKAEMSHLHKLTLENFEGDVSLQSLPSLRSVELDRCSYMFKLFSTYGFKPDLRVFGYSKFSLSHADLELEKLLQLIGPDMEDLRQLSIAHCSGLDALDLIKMVNMGFMDQVVDLDLSGTRVTDDVIELFVPRAQHLQRISLAATSVTGVGVKALVTRLNRKLVRLDISDCQKISPDAVAFARTMPGLILRMGWSEYKMGKKIQDG